MLYRKFSKCQNCPCKRKDPHLKTLRRRFWSAVSNPMSNVTTCGHLCTTRPLCPTVVLHWATHCRLDVQMAVLSLFELANVACCGCTTV